MMKLNLSNGKEFPIRGKNITLYPISTLAEALNRTSQSLRKWEANKIIPKAVFRDKSKRRLYSAEQIELIVAVAEEEQIQQGMSFDGTNFSKRIFDGWKQATEETLKGGRMNA